MDNPLSENVHLRLADRPVVLVTLDAPLFIIGDEPVVIPKPDGWVARHCEIRRRIHRFLVTTYGRRTLFSFNIEMVALRSRLVTRWYCRSRLGPRWRMDLAAIAGQPILSGSGGMRRYAASLRSTS